MTAGSEVGFESAAVARGIAALRARSEGGRFRGFATRAGLSDVWVTAFVVSHLAGLGRTKALVADARRWLAARQTSSGGWSYGGDVPPDADSTSWCLIALRGSPALSSEARRAAEAFLAEHWSQDGVATYLEGVDGIRGYIESGPDVSIAGWTSAHADVTAAALLAGSRPVQGSAAEALARLVEQQTGAGIWEAYWWRGPLYTTAVLMRALARARLALPETQARRLLKALEREQRPHGGFSLGSSTDADAFSTALALDCLRRLSPLGGEASASRAAKALIDLQGDDGTWPGDHVLRIPAPNVTDPRQVATWSRDTGGGNSFVLDDGGLFATAVAVYALGRPEPRDRPSRTLPLRDGPGYDEAVISVGRH